MFRFAIALLRPPCGDPVPKLKPLQLAALLPRLLALYFLMVSCGFVLLYLLGMLLAVCTGNNAVVELWRSGSRNAGVGEAGWLLSVGCAPLMEELAFRLYLGRRRWQFVVSGAMLLCICWSGGPFWLNSRAAAAWLPGSAYLPPAVYMMGITLLPACCLAHYAGPFRLPLRPLVLFSTLLFGLAHLSNYEGLTARNWPLGCLLVFPQLLSGWMLGWLRVCGGMGAACLLHAAINAVCMLPAMAM